ncbi:hypothetical protein ACHAXR_006533 [Thalassiosira sp. AJA248-18]
MMNSRNKNNDSSSTSNNINSETPRSLTQVLLPQLSKPSLCVASLLLLGLVHGINFLEASFGSSSSNVASSAIVNHDHGNAAATSSVTSALFANGHYSSSHQECNISTTLQQDDAQLSPLPLSWFIIKYLLYPTLLLLALLTLLALQYHRLTKIIATTSPIPTIRPVPNAHPYMGHHAQLTDIDHGHPVVFHKHATPSGISAMWGPGLKRCASVLLASHARLILRHSYERDFSEWIIRHGKKTLGADSLILIGGGQRWKRVRKVVAKAFTNKIVKDGRVVVGECAGDCVDWLLRACDKHDDTDENASGENQRSASCNGHGVTKDGKGVVCVEAEDFFKLYALNVFGRVAMGHDFQCIPTVHNDKSYCSNGNTSCDEEDGNNQQELPSSSNQELSGAAAPLCASCGSTNHPQHSQQEQLPVGSSSSSKMNKCNCLTMPPFALAFQSLEADIGRRSSPKSFINPAMQLYWIPTKYNRTYKANMEMVHGLMGRIIGRELEGRLRFLEQQQQEQKEEQHRLSMKSNESSEIEVSSSTASESSFGDEEPLLALLPSENMVTHLLQSCMEQHFSSQSSASPTASPASSRRSSLNPQSSPSSSSKCPFASLDNTSSHDSSIHHHESNGSSSSNIPPPSQITQTDKQTIIQDVTKILHTLLTAGYATTAISLSYVMYCLATNPRCQERCCEEARRVLGDRKKGCNTESTIGDEDLPYCRAVFTESIRMHLPVLFTTRVLSKDLTLDTGYGSGDDENETNETNPRQATLLKGTRVIINPSMIHLDERNFARANEFIPERWVQWDDGEGRWVERDYGEEKENDSPSSIETTNTSPSPPPPFPSSEYTTQHASADTIPPANPCNFFSFSDGARNCVGRRLAIMEATLLIATLLRDMCVGLGDDDFELRKELRFVTVKPAGLPVRFWKRQI